MARQCTLNLVSRLSPPPHGLAQVLYHMQIQTSSHPLCVKLLKYLNFCDRRLFDCCDIIGNAAVHNVSWNFNVKGWPSGDITFQAGDILGKSASFLLIYIAWFQNFHFSFTSVLCVTMRICLQQLATSSEKKLLQNELHYNKMNVMYSLFSNLSIIVVKTYSDTN